MKVALVHDYLREFGGAERVLEQLHQIFPEAPIFTAYYNPAGLGVHNERIKKWDIRTSWLQQLPFANKLISPLRIFAPMIFEGFNLGDYDVVISSCSIYFAKAVITRPETLHISYIHTPPRYLYGYTTSFNYKKNLLTRILGELANHILRIYDFEVSQRPDILVANSQNVAERIKKFYRRDAVVIYPPVEVKSIEKQVVGLSTEKDYFLSLSRLVRGKGVDTIVEACSRLQLPLKVVGSGPLQAELEKQSGETIEFLGGVKDEDRAELYLNAKALIVASEDEDFGITAVEAMAAGTPVIAVRAGGYLETIVGEGQGKTGEFIDTASVEDLTVALQNFDVKKYKSTDCQEQAEKFSAEKFKESILKLINENFKERAPLKIKKEVVVG